MFVTKAWQNVRKESVRVSVLSYCISVVQHRSVTSIGDCSGTDFVNRTDCYISQQRSVCTEGITNNLIEIKVLGAEMLTLAEEDFDLLSLKTYTLE